MPAKAGIHSHRPVFMDSGIRRNDNEGEPVIQTTRTCSSLVRLRRWQRPQSRDAEMRYLWTFTSKPTRRNSSSVRRQNALVMVSLW
jgi:hypothetical protein